MVLGPFEASPLPNLWVSPLGVVPKKAPWEFRLIHHLSYPRGSSMNDTIPEELSLVRYAYKTVAMVKGFGGEAELV